MVRKKKEVIPQQMTFASEVDNKFGEFDAILNSFEEVGDPIHLHISSPGGDLNTALAMAGRVGLCKAHLTTIAFGEVCSSAVAIFVCGKVRYMEKNAMLMIHETQVDMDSIHLSEAKEFITRIEEMDNKFYTILEEHSFKPVDYWKELVRKNEKREIWLSAKQALKLGLCDKII